MSKRYKRVRWRRGLDYGVEGRQIKEKQDFGWGYEHGKGLEWDITATIGSLSPELGN